MSDVTNVSRTPSTLNTYKFNKSTNEVGTKSLWRLATPAIPSTTHSSTELCKITFPVPQTEKQADMTWE